MADFDRDDRRDVAMRMDGRTQLWLQDSGGGWTEVVLTHPPHEGLEAGDLEGDGDPDAGSAPRRFYRAVERRSLSVPSPA